MNISEKEYENKDWLPTEDLPMIPKSYTVPNFGMDRDISGGIENLSAAEAIVGHKWKWDASKYMNASRNNDHTPAYEEGSKLDNDIIVSQNNLSATEK